MTYDYDRVEVQRQENRKLKMQLMAVIAALAVIVAGIVTLWVLLVTITPSQLVTSPKGKLECTWVPEAPTS